ncbi:MAG: BNR-4 repeat-containing protein, partial [Devosia sp.]
RRALEHHRQVAAVVQPDPGVVRERDPELLPDRVDVDPGPERHRGVGLDPNYLISEDGGRGWRYGGKLFVGLDGYSPYCKYVSDGKATIHVVCTEDHPNNYDNSLYHAFIRGGQVHRSDGAVLGPLSTTTNSPLRPWDFTRIYQGGPNHVAWMTDIELDPEKNPVVLFTVQMNSAGLPSGRGGYDHRFHLARWDGGRWRESEIAYAGKRLYAGEDDYTGLGAIDPQNPDVVYISTDADPQTGAPLISSADGNRHHELFRGETKDRGATWRWLPVTENSTMDNLRPIVPRWQDTRTALVWFRGSYRANHGEWTTKVMASILTAKDFPSP